MLISDWSSDVCSSDLVASQGNLAPKSQPRPKESNLATFPPPLSQRKSRSNQSAMTWTFLPWLDLMFRESNRWMNPLSGVNSRMRLKPRRQLGSCLPIRSEEHTSELQSLMRISYAVFCLKKKTLQTNDNNVYTVHI